MQFSSCCFRCFMCVLLLLLLQWKCSKQTRNLWHTHYTSLKAGRPFPRSRMQQSPPPPVLPHHTLLEQEMHSLIWRRTGLLLVPVIKVDSPREIAFACLYKDLICVNRMNRTAQRSSLLYCSLVGSNKLYRAMRNAHKVNQIAWSDEDREENKVLYYSILCPNRSSYTKYKTKH